MTAVRKEKAMNLKHLLFLLALLALPATAADRVLIGVIDVPGLFGAPTAAGYPGAEAPEHPELPLYESPGDAAPARVVHEPERIMHDDIEYERQGALAYASTRDGWFQVKDRGSETDPGGYFWASPASITEFKSYFSLIEGGAWLSAAWDGKVYPYVKTSARQDVPPAVGAPLPQPAGWAKPISSVTDENGKLWILAVFYDTSECESETGIIKIIGAGYVPAHLPNGAPVFPWALYC